MFDLYRVMFEIITGEQRFMLTKDPKFVKEVKSPFSEFSCEMWGGGSQSMHPHEF